MRRFPGESVMGTIQLLSEDHVTVAPVPAPVSSFSESAVVLTLFGALFQLVLATTPALSEVPIDVPLPTKSILMTRAGGFPRVAVKLAVWFAVMLVKVRLGGVN